MEIKKILAVGIILLFVGVAVAPSINTSIVKASQDDDLVEVTTQACGIQGYGDTTVKLTRQQYNDLEKYLVDFRARLNQTSTRQDAVPLFKEAVVELDKYGLLPKGMSVERVQKLIVGRFQNERMMKLVETFYKKNQKEMGFNFNVFCLVAGESTRTHFIGYPLFPIKLFSMITLGYTISDRWIYYEEDYDAGGEVISIGLLGRKIASGSIYGSFFDIPIPGLYSIYEFHVGIIGFTGVRLGVLGYYFYFGSALFTSVDYLF